MDQEMRLEIRALRQRWPVEEAYRARIIRRLMAIALDPESKNRDANQAIRSLLAAEAQNQKDEHLAAVQSDRNRFLAIAERLGIDADIKRVTEVGTGSGSTGVDGERGDG